MPVFGPMRGLSSTTSWSQSFSASGSLIKILLQDQLRGDRIDRLLLQSAQPVLGFNRCKALVDARDRQLETPLEPPREVLGLARHPVRLALGGREQPHDQTGGFPLLDQLLNLEKIRNCRQRVRGAKLRLPDCNADTLETEVEGEDRASLRHVPPRPAASRNRGRGVPSPPADVLPPAFRR